MKFFKYLQKLVKKGIISEKRANTLFEAGRKGIKGYHGLKNIPTKVKEFPGRFANRPAGLTKMENKARKQVEKELLNDASYEKWLKPSTDNLKSRINKTNEKIKDFKQYHMVGGTVRNARLLGKLKDYEGMKIKDLTTLKDLMSKKTRKNYNAAVKLQVRNTPLKFSDVAKSDGKRVAGRYQWGEAVHPEQFNRNMKGLDISGDPSNISAMSMKHFIRQYKKGKNKSIKRDINLAKEHDILKKVTGNIEVSKTPWNRGEQYRTTVHELKHAAQAPMYGFSHGDAMLKHVPKNVLKGKTLDFLDDPDYMEYLLKPQEIGARLSELRALNPIKRVGLFKGWSKGKDVKAYQDLLKVFRTPENISKALKDNWGMAPLGGLLGGGAINGE